MKSNFTPLISAFLLLGSLYTTSTVNAAPNEATPTPVTDKNIIPEYTKPIKMSDRFEKIVSHGYGTMIPKGVILFLPDTHKAKIAPFYKKATMVSNDVFFAKNRDVVHVIPLTKSQAFGAKNTPKYKISYEKLEDLKKLGRIIICTYKNTPVRVKVQEKAAE